MTPTTKKRLSAETKKNPTTRYRKRKNMFKKKGLNYNYKVCVPQFNLEDFCRNQRYLSKKVIAPKNNISKSSVQVNVNCLLPSSTFQNSSHEKKLNVAIGRNKENNDIDDDATITDPEYNSDLSSTVSLYEGSSASEGDSSDNENPKK